MPYGNKLKTVSRLALLNSMVLDGKHADFVQELNNDPVLKGLNQDMVVIEGKIRAKAGGGGNVNQIQAPPPVPVPKRRWFGELAFDTTSPGKNKKGDDIIVYDNQKAMRANALAFRDRIDDLLKLREQENDLGNLQKEPNPGGYVGDPAHRRHLAAGAGQG